MKHSEWLAQSSLHIHRLLWQESTKKSIQNACEADVCYPPASVMALTIAPVTVALSRNVLTIFGLPSSQVPICTSR